MKHRVKGLSLLTTTLIIFSFLFMFSPFVAISSDNQMTGDQLNQLLGNGKTLILGGEEEGYEGELILNADGTGKGQAVTKKGKTIRIEGTWEIVGDEFCRVWKEVSKGKRVCERWIFIGENKVEVIKDGKKVGVNSW